MIADLDDTVISRVRERSPAAGRLTPEGFLCLSIPSASRRRYLDPDPRRDFRFPSRLNPLAVAGRAIINARGKPNRRGGGLLWDDHNIWTASSTTPQSERAGEQIHASSQSRAGKTFDSSSARIGAREEIISDMWNGAERKENGRECHIKGELCGRARECCCSWEFCSSINSVPSSPQNHASVS